MGDVLTFKRPLRALLCEGCGCSFLSRHSWAWLCDRCDGLLEEELWARSNEEARARGYASWEEEYAAWERGDTSGDAA